MYTNSPLEGSPTPYTIVLCPLNEEKWKLCAQTKEDQFRWCQVLEKYTETVVVVPGSRESIIRQDNIYHPFNEVRTSNKSSVSMWIHSMELAYIGVSRKTF